MLMLEVEGKERLHQRWTEKNLVERAGRGDLRWGEVPAGKNEVGKAFTDGKAEGWQAWVLLWGHGYVQ